MRTALAFALLVLAGSASAAPVPGAATPKGHYAALDRLPDWGGVWVLAPAPGPQPVAKGEYAKRLAARKAFADANNGEYPRDFSYCAPPGVTYQMALGQYPIEFLFTPGRVTINLEAWMQTRRVFTDGRGHPEDLELSLNGHSIGHWEGDTLVVDTVGLKPQARIVVGLEHSDQERIVERIHLDPKDPDTLIDEMTVIDPEALEKPWLNVLKYKRHREWDLIEFVCSENDLNPVGADGKGVFGPTAEGR
jgi:hypothetical protein